jgi:hypothetical protein
MLVVWRGGGVQEDRGDGLGGGVRYAGYCLGPKCSDSPRTARATITHDDAKHPVAEQPCAAFEAWFLDPNC